MTTNSLIIDIVQNTIETSLSTTLYKLNLVNLYR